MSIREDLLKKYVKETQESGSVISDLFKQSPAQDTKSFLEQYKVPERTPVKKDVGGDILKKFIAGGVPRVFEKEKAPETYLGAVKEKIAEAREGIKGFEKLTPKEQGEKLAFSFMPMGMISKIPKGIISKLPQKLQPLKKEIKITPEKVKKFLGKEPIKIIKKKETVLLKTRLKTQDIIGKTKLKGVVKLAREKVTATSKLQKTIRQSELKILKENIKTRATKDKIIISLKDRASNIKNIKKDIYSFTKETLPLEKRGKLLASVASAETRGDLAGAFRRIIITRNNIVRKELTQNIEKIVDRMEKLPLKWQDKILYEVDNIVFKGMSKKTIEKLNKLKGFLEKQPEAELLFGKRTLKKVGAIERMAKQNIDDIQIKDLIQLNAKINRFFEEGKLVQKTIAGTKQLKQDITLNNLIKTSNNIDKEIPRTIGVKLSSKEKLIDYKYQKAQQIQEGYMNYVSTDIGFEVLDNNVRLGTNMRTFKLPFDRAFLKYKNMSSEMVENYFNVKKGIEAQHNMKFQRPDMENIMIYATRMQKGGIEKLKKSGIARLLPKGTSLEQFKLNKPQQELYQAMRKTFDDLHPHIDKTLQSAHNRKLGTVENYFSWQTDFNNSSEVFKRLENDYLQISRTQQNFTKARTLGGQILKLNAEDIFLKHINDSTYFVHTEELLNDLGKLARTNDYAKAVGINGQKWVNGWVDLMARKGIPEGYAPTFISTLLNNVGSGILGFRISPIVKQPLAKITSSALLGKHAFKYDPLFFKHNLAPYVKKISKQQMFRTFDDPAYTELAKSKKLAEWQKWGYQGIKWVDGYTADSVWYSAYRKYFADNNLKFSLTNFKKGLKNTKALEYADLITRRTQGTGEAKDMARMLISGKREFFRSVLKFQTFILNESYLIPHDAIGVAFKTEKNIPKAIGIVFAYLMATLAEDYITSGVAQVFSPKEYAKKEREKEISERFFDGLISKTPFVNNIYGMYKYGSSGTVITDLPKNLVSGSKSLFTGKKPETQLKGLSRILETLAGMVGIAGAGQAGQAYRRYGIKETSRTDDLLEDIFKDFGVKRTTRSKTELLVDDIFKDL